MDKQAEGVIRDPRATGKFAADTAFQLFRQAIDGDSCLSLSTQLNQRFDSLFAALRDEGAPIACKAGCSFCCYVRVQMLPHEAIALFWYLKSRLPADVQKAVIDRLRANANRIKAIGVDRHHVTNVQCAFLVDGKCSAYEVRPIACSVHHPMNVQACEHSFNNPEDQSTPIPANAVPSMHATTAMRGVGEAMRVQGLNIQGMELNAAVAALVRDPTRIKRWREKGPLLKPDDRAQER